MRRGNIFWGIVLIVLGLFFYLKTLGLINDVIGWFWPVALILLGIWVLIEPRLPSTGLSAESFSIDLQGATSLDLDLSQGAGLLAISAGAPAGVAITGSQADGLNLASKLDGEKLTVSLEAGPTFLRFLGPQSGEWRFFLTREVPVSINLDAGASSLNLDLTDVRLSLLSVDTGASSLKLILPDGAGHSLVQIESGAAALDITLPEGLGARIRFEQAASSLDIDEKRFPRLTQMERLYQSIDYGNAANKVEINLDGGANSVIVH